MEANLPSAKEDTPTPSKIIGSGVSLFPELLNPFDSQFHAANDPKRRINRESPLKNDMLDTPVVQQLANLTSPHKADPRGLIDFVLNRSVVRMGSSGVESGCSSSEPDSSDSHEAPKKPRLEIQKAVSDVNASPKPNNLTPLEVSVITELVSQSNSTESHLLQQQPPRTASAPQPSSGGAGSRYHDEARPLVKAERCSPPDSATTGGSSGSTVDAFPSTPSFSGITPELSQQIIAAAAILANSPQPRTPKELEDVATYISSQISQRIHENTAPSGNVPQLATDSPPFLASIAAPQPVQSLPDALLHPNQSFVNSAPGTILMQQPSAPASTILVPPGSDIIMTPGFAQQSASTVQVQRFLTMPRPPPPPRPADPSEYVKQRIRATVEGAVARDAGGATAAGAAQPFIKTELPDIGQHGDHIGGTPDKWADLRERNRQAAARSRDKKKKMFDELQAQAKENMDLNEALTAEVSMLKNEVRQLKAILVEHRSCPLLHQQLASSATKLDASSSIIVNQATSQAISQATSQAPAVSQAHDVSILPAFSLTSSSSEPPQQFVLGSQQRGPANHTSVISMPPVNGNNNNNTIPVSVASSQNGDTLHDSKFAELLRRQDSEDPIKASHQH